MPRQEPQCIVTDRRTGAEEDERDCLVRDCVFASGKRSTARGIKPQTAVGYEELPTVEVDKTVPVHVRDARRFEPKTPGEHCGYPRGGERSSIPNPNARKRPTP